MNRDLWKCPKCRQDFKLRNQSHSCGNFSVEEFFKIKGLDDFDEEFLGLLKLSYEVGAR